MKNLSRYFIPKTSFVWLERWHTYLHRFVGHYLALSHMDNGITRTIQIRFMSTSNCVLYQPFFLWNSVLLSTSNCVLYQPFFLWSSVLLSTSNCVLYRPFFLWNSVLLSTSNCVLYQPFFLWNSVLLQNGAKQSRFSIFYISWETIEENANCRSFR